MNQQNPIQPLLSPNQYLSSALPLNYSPPLCFQCTPATLKVLPRIPANASDLTLHLAGVEVKAQNKCCYNWTIAMGSIVLFPFAFMLCKWWDRKVYPAYEIPIESYQSLGEYLLEGKQLKNIVISIADNNFTKQKGDILSFYLKKMTNVATFHLSNSAIMFDWKNDEFNKFPQSVESISKLPIVTKMQWGPLEIK